MVVKILNSSLLLLRATLQQALVLEVLSYLGHSLLHAGLLRVDMDLRLLRRLIRCAHARELLDLA